VLDIEHVVAMIDWQMMSASAPTATVAFLRSGDSEQRPDHGQRYYRHQATGKSLDRPTESIRRRETNHR
jgi:hypothetical protein